MHASLTDTRLPVPSGTPALELEHVTVRLGGRTVLDNLSFQIDPGEFVGVIGPNGAGKTTLIRTLLGLQRVSSGSVRLFGKPPRRGNPAIGYVPQHHTLHASVPLRARDMVALGLCGTHPGLLTPGIGHDPRVQAVLSDVGATKYADAPVGRLSGGEQQRLMLAQALVDEPRLLLLDEPLANLDLRGRREVVNLVCRVSQARGIAVLFVAHDINPLLGSLDRVLYLAGGRGVLGTPERVVRDEVLSDLYGFPVHVVRAEGQILIGALGTGDDCHA